MLACLMNGRATRFISVAVSPSSIVQCPRAALHLKMLSRPRSVSSRPNPTLDGPCIATYRHNPIRPSLHVKLINAVLMSDRDR